ncbi:MAG TPA: sigma-70 family RNA polymerase sigma factor [Candidatus Didemnitutus sp.]|nr:sigma-70 family RNA polymerase sigma factor [Candidatus Didemnitutus sp.]
MPTDPATDRASLLALQKGETAALNQLISRWQRPLLSFAYRYVQNATDAHDLVAETFVRLYQQRLRLRPDTNLAAWLFTTLTNLCHNHHRWKRRHPTVALGAPEHAESGHGGGGVTELPTEQPAPDAALVHDEALAAVRAAIDRLPHDLKTAVLLHHYEHLSYREISTIVGCSERGVETRLYRAKQQLRHSLGAWLNETVAH